MRNLDLLLVSEMDATEHEAFRARWIESWLEHDQLGPEDPEDPDAARVQATVADAQFERYMEQEGHTARDERVSSSRDTLWRHAVHALPHLPDAAYPRDVVVDRVHGRCFFCGTEEHGYSVWRRTNDVWVCVHPTIDAHAYLLEVGRWQQAERYKK